MGPVYLKSRCQVLLTVPPAPLGLGSVTLQVCSLLGTLAGTAQEGDCDMNLMFHCSITLAEGEREATTSTYMFLSALTSVPSFDHYKSPGN